MGIKSVDAGMLKAAVLASAKRLESKKEWKIYRGFTGEGKQTDWSKVLFSFSNSRNMLRERKGKKRKK